MSFDTDVSFQPRGKIFLLQKSIALKGHYDSMFWVETTFPNNWFLIRWSLSKECPLVGKFSASDLRNDISEFDSRHDVTMSISYQIIHCKKDLKNEIPKSFKETSYFWLKIICKNVQPRLFPVFIHWNNLTNHNKPNIKVIISWSIWVVVQTLFKCLSFSLIL